jgi:hypothetical protein
VFPESPRSEEATLAKRHNDEYSATLWFLHCHTPRLTHPERFAHDFSTFYTPSIVPFLSRLFLSVISRVISRDSPDSGRPTPP